MRTSDLDGRVGQGWGGTAPDGCHVNVVLARRGSPDGGGRDDRVRAPAPGHTPVLVCVGPVPSAYEAVMPPTIMTNKATATEERHASLTWGAAQLGIAQGVLDAVADGLLDADLDTIVLVAVWVDPAATDERRGARRHPRRDAGGDRVGGERRAAEAIGSGSSRTATPDEPVLRRRLTTLGGAVAVEDAAREGVGEVLDVGPSGRVPSGPGTAAPTWAPSDRSAAGTGPPLRSTCQAIVARPASAPSRQRPTPVALRQAWKLGDGDVVLAEAAEAEQCRLGERPRLLGPARLHHVQRLERPLLAGERRQRARVLEELVGVALDELADVGPRGRQAVERGRAPARCGSRRSRSPRRAGARRRAAGRAGCRSPSAATRSPPARPRPARGAGRRARAAGSGS